MSAPHRDSLSSRAPVHLQIRKYLQDRIQSGAFTAGDQLPTEPDLMKQFGVSRTTVRRALHDLAASGVIERQPGRGTFVRPLVIEQELTRLTGFVEDMHALGLKPTAKVITVESQPASSLVADALGLSLGAECIHIERVRLANTEPVSFDDSYLPPDIGRAIAAEDLQEHPFYSILEEKLAIPLGQADYTLQAIPVSSRVATLLAVKSGAPALLIERTTRAHDGNRPLVFEYLHYRGDRTRYRLRLQR